ncbi:MAG: alpha/beta fold hydrolase [Kofleriaceae bacterium]
MATRLVVGAVLAAVVGCEQGPATTALFAVPGGVPGDDFYALPFPNDLRRDPDGTLDLSAFPTNSLIVDSYRAAADTLDGFGLNQAIYARFDGPLDPETVPDPRGSLDPQAAVYLIDIDPASPAYGERVPIAARFRADPTVTLGPNHLVARPYPGFGLTDGTTYALIVTDRVTGNGVAVKRAPAFDQLMGTGGELEILAAREVYAPLLAWLDEAGGDERSDVITAAVFTTQRATATVPAIRRAIFAAPGPVATNITAGEPMPGFRTFLGAYKAANVQSGAPPYRNAPAGEIVIGADGAAVIQRMEQMRFALTVPPTTVPAAGWPIVIYSHGTGGDHLSFVRDGTAAALAAQGIAVISTDQVLHGPRNPGGEPELDFFNFANPYAMRDNTLQGAADAFSQLRLVQTLRVAGQRFDATRIYFFGHSQGGVTGPGFVAFEPSLTGAVFSGTGGLLYLTLLTKTKPLDVPMLVETFLRDDPVDEDNPSLALFQMWAERADGANYAPLMARRPVATARNIFQTEGFVDEYTPNPSIEAFGVALGGDVVSLPDATEVAGLTLRDRSIVAPPFSNNVAGVTVALAQYQEAPDSDGHFVVFDVPAATRQAAEFLGTLARTGTATVVAP